MNAAARDAGPLRVVIVTPTLDTGGSERQIVKLSSAIDHDEVELTIVILFGAYRHALIDDVDKRVAVVRPRYFHHDPRMPAWLGDVVSERRADVVHSFLWNADLYAAAAKRRGGTFALICSERGDRSLGGLLSPLRRSIDRRLTFREADLACANSEYGRELLVRRGFPRERTRLVRNGVDVRVIDAIASEDVRRQYGWPDDVVVAGTVSRLIDYKGIEILVDAMHESRDDGDLRCVIVGDGPQRRTLERHARRHHLQERLVFAGMERSPEAFVKAFDIFVLPTIAAEHSSNAIIEAMACAKPVIASRVGGNAELVVDGETGLLVDAGDSAALAAAMQRLASDRTLRLRMGTAGRKRIEEDFRMDVIAPRLMEVWRSAVS
jgi:glycosyltransferase involved in cell wall biosynthesis